MQIKVILALCFVVILGLSMVGQASALSAITFTSKGTIASRGQQFQQVFEYTGQPPYTTFPFVYFLDANGTTTYFKSHYDVNNGVLAGVATTTISGSGNTLNSNAYLSPVDTSKYSVSLNGSTQYVSFGSDFTNFSGDFTIVAKVKSAGAGRNPIFGDKTGGGSTGALLVQKETTAQICLWANNGGGDNFICGNTSINTSGTTWYNVSVRRIGSAITIFLNGVIDGTGTLGGSIDSGTAPAVGTTPAGLTNFWNGKIKDVGFYNTGLTDNQISTIATGGYVGSPIAFIDFNDGIGTSAKDIASTNTGTLQAGASWSSDVPASGLVRLSTYAIGRDTSTGKNGYAKLNVSDLSKVGDNYQVSTLPPRNIAQSTAKLYSPLYDASVTDGKINLGIINRDFTSYSEPLIYSGSSGNPTHGILMDTSAAASTQNAIYSGSVTVIAEKVTATSVLVGKKLDRMTLYLSKTNAPTGTATIGVFDSSGTATFTCATQNVASLTGSSSAYVYFCSSPYIIQSGDRIGIKFTGGDATNHPNADLTNSDVFDGTNSIASQYSGSWADSGTSDLRGIFADTANVKIAVIDGSPDTEYVFFESGASSLAVVKYTNSATTISTSLTHTAGKEYSIIQTNGSIIIQTDSKTYSLNTSTDAITTLYSTSFLTRYPQSFTISPATRTYNTAQPMIANSTYAATVNLNTGAITQTGVLVSSTNNSAGTLTTYQPSSWYYLPANSLSTEGPATTWTIKSIGSNVQIAPTAYSERLGVNLQTNSTLFSQDVFRLVCATGSYHAIYSKYAIGSDSDCTQWQVLATSSATVGRQLYAPYSRTQDLVQANPFTGYTFTIDAATPTTYQLKSIYNGKTVDVANFDSSGQLQQRYLYGQCYSVQVTNVNTGASALVGNICANDVTTKPIVLNTVNLPVNWQGYTWAWNVSRNMTSPLNNIITFSVDKSSHPYSPKINVVNNIIGTPTLNNWYNYSNMNGPTAISVSGIYNNQTLYFRVYENATQVVSAVVAGQSLSIPNIFAPMGNIFGVSAMVFLVVFVAGIFPRSAANIGILAVLIMSGLLWTFGLLPNMNPLFWAGMIGLGAVGLFAHNRR